MSVVSRTARTCAAVCALAATAPAGAQSLFQRPATPPAPPSGAPGQAPAEPSAPQNGFAEAPNAPEHLSLAGNGKANPVAELAGVSLYAIQPVAPKRFQVHDQITIIVNQSSKVQRDQSLKTDKKYDDKIDLAAFPSLLDIFKLNVPPDGRLATNNPQLDLKSQGKFDGKGDYTREDRFTARITATVIDVKPNGVLVLEARSSTVSDKEEQTMVLSGSCRTEDVTTQNTVQSTQLADLRLETRNKGEVKEGASKGILTKVFETLFNF